MATNLVPFEVPANLLQELQDLFGPDQSNKDLTEGVQPSFAVVTFRGKVWRVRYKGEDRMIQNADGDPMPFIVCVIAKASPAISKLYYSKSYTEGDDAPPICFSLDGVKPDASSTEKQSPSCAACPHNVWGSRITESGSKAKACADSRRLAVVPYPDIDNEAFGGPMLLRVPPTSINELARFGDALRQSNTPYQAIVVKVSFDYEMAYPKLVFQAVRPLKIEEAKRVLEHMHSEQVLRMLMEPVQGDETGAAEEARSAPEKAAEPPAPQPADKAPPKPKPAPAPAQAPVEEEEEEEEVAQEAPQKKTPAKAAAAPADVVSSELNSMISGLLNA